MWALKQAFKCERCKDTVSGLELDECQFHAKSAEFRCDQNLGEYPCCGQVAHRFHPF